MLNLIMNASRGRISSMAKTNDEPDLKLVIEEKEFLKYLHRAFVAGITTGWNANNAGVRRLEAVEYEKFLEFLSRDLPHYKVTKKRVKQWYARSPKGITPENYFQ